MASDSMDNQEPTLREIEAQIDALLADDGLSDEEKISILREALRVAVSTELRGEVS